MKFYADDKDELDKKLEAARTLAEQHHDVTVYALYYNSVPVPLKGCMTKCWGNVEITNVRRKYATGKNVGDDVVLDGVEKFRIELN